MALAVLPDKCFVGNGWTVRVTEDKTGYAGHVGFNSPAFFLDKTEINNTQNILL